MPFEGLAPEQLTLLVILIAASSLLLTERIRIDLTAVLIILALVITGLLEPEQALSGFGSEPAVVVAAILLSEAIFRTGLSDRLGHCRYPNGVSPAIKVGNYPISLDALLCNATGKVGYVEVFKMNQQHPEKKTIDDDLTLKTQISDALADHPATQDAVIEVINDRGIIALEGEVADAETREVAGEIVKKQPGVISVTNSLKIARRNS